MHSSYADRFRGSLFKYCITAAGLLLAFGIFFGDSAAIAADWPQWLGPLRNGVSDETVEPWQQPPRVVWKQTIGNGFSRERLAFDLHLF